MKLGEKRGLCPNTEEKLKLSPKLGDSLFSKKDLQHNFPYVQNSTLRSFETRP